MTTKFRVARQRLQTVLDQDKYLPYSVGQRTVTKTGEVFPVTFIEKIKTYINPVSVLHAYYLKKFLRNFEDYREAANTTFLERELARNAKLFDDIGGFPLDDQQRRAIVADEDNCLVIAGAGSGKTLTIVGKVKYLLESLQVEADSILPISFTRKSADSLKEKINVKGIHPQTFHAFGLTVLQSVEHRKPKIFDGADNGKLFRSYLEHLAKDPAYLTLLNSFFLNYIKIPKSQFEFESLGDYIQYLKDQNFNTYKRIKIPYQGRETYRNETVKSIEECIIANFLIFNRVEYAYEKQYEHPYAQFGRKKSYKPDFTIFTDNGEVYIEHLGMDREGNVPSFFAGPKESHDEATRRYGRLRDWKRRVHQQNGTTLIETYSYQSVEGTLLDELKAGLIAAGVKLQPMSDDEIWQAIQDAGKDQVDAFVELCQTFLALLKSNGHSVQDARDKNDASEAHDFLKERATFFLNLFEPIYVMYEDGLRNSGEIDFNDMITQATRYIEDGDFYCPLKYVIVDEFQDLSFGRYRILQAIRRQNPDVKFYCVGDDWQSIFRFTGSDIALFRDFDEHFGYTYKARIETTYRFNDPLITMSSEFILKNPNQSPKSLRAPEGTPSTGHTVIESDGSDDDTDAVIAAIHTLADKGLTLDSEAYLIGRYNFDIKRIWNRGKQFTINFTTGHLKYTFPTGPFKGRELNLQFVTAHKSKGLEADYTILINCNSGKYGFPSGKADDPILNLLLSSADQYENGEERRLFYVAMTRTKRHVVFVTDRYRKSKFIKELQDEQDGGRELKCPQCQNGELILRSGKTAGRGFKFYGCSNFAYGCGYSKPYRPDEVKAESNLNSTNSTLMQTRQPNPGMAQSTYSSNSGRTQPSYSKQRTGLSNKPRISSKPSSTSGLTVSQKNKLEYFVKKPTLYATSEKGEQKVRDLAKVSSKMDANELATFNQAYMVWENAALLKNKAIF
ncbi:MAG TPA: UvrD-helicase domain-containing protein [Candidatus Saccharimonadales bacterium]|nr:UvrD-helicase domain-containing protein [Candidatus Saccharimonadales bacterium]